MWDCIEIVVKQIEVHHELILAILLVLSSLLLIGKKSRCIGFVIAILLLCLLANHWSCYLLVIAILLLLILAEVYPYALKIIKSLLGAYSGSPVASPATQNEQDIATMSDVSKSEYQGEDDQSKQSFCFTPVSFSQKAERFKHARDIEGLALQYLAARYPELQSHVAIQLPNGSRYVLDGLIKQDKVDILVEINIFFAGGPNQAMLTSKYQQLTEYAKYVKHDTRLLWLWVTSKENVKSIASRRASAVKVFESANLDLQIIDESDLMKINEDCK